MKLWIELLSTFAGLLSFAIILFSFGMGIYFARMFILKSAIGGDLPQRLSSKPKKNLGSLKECHFH